MATVKGTWTFKDTLTPFPLGLEVIEEVHFTNGYGESCVGFSVLTDLIDVPTLVHNIDLEDLYDSTLVYCYEKGDFPLGWMGESFKTIDFGETEQTVSDEFYAWLVENTVGDTSAEVISFDITENGTTTLATAGKYCDRNIDVNVGVSTYEEELLATKKMFASVLDKSVVEYKDDTTTLLGWFAFRYCRSMVKADFSKLNRIRSGALQNCDVFATLILRTNSVVTLEYADAFASTLISSGTGLIYVPGDLVDSYKTATNWVTFADQIKPISELEG